MEKPHKRTKIGPNSSLDTNHNNTDHIPTDIVNEILQRLPAKSVAKFVRVSKSWAKIIRSNYFINSFSVFQIQQQPHNRLLFAIKSQEKWSFYSSSYEKSLSEFKFMSRIISEINGGFHSPIYVNGLLSFMCNIDTITQIISNPSTGKSIVLPLIQSKREILCRFFGFDPIKGEYKILCITKSMYGSGSRFSLFQNQILTLESNTNTSLWREIDVWIPHRPHHSKGVCINGVIYYLAYETLSSLELSLVRFDLSSEKFLNILPCGEFLEPLGRPLSLINYESKLGITHQNGFNSVDLWVLEDGDNEKLEWLKISIDVSPLRSFIYSFNIEFLGTSSSGEIVYSCYCHYGYFDVIYHDLKKNHHRKVQFNVNSRCYSANFIDYVESVMLL